ncbi:serine hydrolase [Moraxella nasovis]|nr:serine hydrolase [Moraxella nasovis]UNU74346.1 serine hydrolase [Moraxella nasovis]
MLMTVGAAYQNAQAFIVDNSHQKTVTLSRSQFSPSQSSSTYAVTATPITEINQVIKAEPTQTITRHAPKVVQTITKPTYTPVTTTPVTAQASSQFSSSYAQNDSFENFPITTESSSVAVVDLQTGKLIYGKNIDHQRSIASVSKVMTAMVILDSGLDMREEITLIASDLVGAKKASTKLKAGDRMSRSELTLLMLMKSENPAAKALARTYTGGYDAFIRAMNQKAYSLGMYQTSFADSSGLNPNNKSSASDLVKMMTAVSSQPRYQTIRNFSTAPSYDFYIANDILGDRVLKSNNTSRLVRAGAYPIGVSKTGYIREAGYCVVMETHVNNRPAIVVLLGAKASNSRWNDAENILTELAYRN